MPPSEAWADRARARIESLSGRSVRSALEIGKLIGRAKETLPHGFYGPWEASLPFSPDTVLNYRRLWKEFGGVDFRTVRNIELTALHELSAPSCPEKAREEAIGRAERGERVKARDARELVARHRPPDPPDVPCRYADVPTDVAAVAKEIRGSQIELLEKAYRTGRLGEALWRDAGSEELREHGREVLAEVQRALFPEEFGEPSRRYSLCPPPGPRRVGAQKLRLFAEKVLGMKAG